MLARPICFGDKQALENEHAQMILEVIPYGVQKGPLASSARGPFLNSFSRLFKSLFKVGHNLLFAAHHAGQPNGGAFGLDAKSLFHH